MVAATQSGCTLLLSPLFSQAAGRIEKEGKEGVDPPPYYVLQRGLIILASFFFFPLLSRSK